MLYHVLRTHSWVFWTLLQAPLVSPVQDGTSGNNPTKTVSASSCEARSINYVTHGLPQQCLNPATRYTSTDSTTAGQNESTGGPNPAAPSALITIVETQTPSPEHPNKSSATKPEQSSAHDSNTVAVVSASSSLNNGGAESIGPSLTVEPSPVESEAESFLDNAKFLSFEEWKKENLAQAGQSAENLQHARNADTQGKERRRPGINNALDSLGEDSEIDLDFSGFGNGDQAASQSQQPRATSNKETQTQETPSATVVTPARRRSKDAGKTCKERFNYASFDCAANVLKTNPQCKSSSSILVENKDSYMLNECSAENKFLIVELCNDILVDTVVLANFEFFSSLFRAFRVSVSDRYPVKIDKWQDLGTYEARNSREIQAFLIENPLIWARYLRIEFLSHYGNEYYCPLSLLRIHGTTMMEEYREEQKKAQGEFDADDDEIEESNGSVVTADNLPPPQPTAAADTVDSKLPSPEPAGLITATPTSICVKVDPASSVFFAGPTEDPICKVTESPIPPSSITNPTTTTASENIASHTVTEEITPSVSGSSPNEQPSTVSKTPSSNEGGSPTPSDQYSSANTSTPASVSQSAVKVVSQASQSAVAVAATPVSPTTPPTPSSQPATQESFFKSINKRLSFLETNATLSLQYIESQSQLLRDAFSKVEKRNIAKASEFLNALNVTVLAELARYKAEYEQLWQSTVLELSSQREEGRKEREVMGERIRLLAEEMVGQKRLMAVQATLLLLCLVLVVFGKFSAADVSWVQSMQGLVRKSRPNSRRRKSAQQSFIWDSPWGSYPHSRGSPRPSSSHGPNNRMHEIGRSLSSGAVDEMDGMRTPEQRPSPTRKNGSIDQSGDDIGDSGDEHMTLE